MLGAFAFEWRSALVGTVAIAMSLAAAWLVLYFTDTTVNTMILAGLVMALVALIDDAVIDVGNVAAARPTASLRRVTVPPPGRS